MVSCSTANLGCQGGYMLFTWLYLENQGIVTDTCYPYASGKGKEFEC